MSGRPPCSGGGGYGADLARVHHEGFGDLARHAAAVLLDLLARGDGTDAGDRGGRLVVDLGSGTGILAQLVTDAGYPVLGVDISPDMVRLASGHAPRAHFVRAALLDAEIPPCAAVTAIGEVLNYAVDPRINRPRLTALFRRMATALAPDGVALLDVAGPGRAGPTGRRMTSSTGDGWSIRSVAQEEQGGATLVRSISLVIDRGDGDPPRTVEEHHVLRLFSARQMEAALRAGGFADVRRLDHYGDLELGPGLTGFLARPPAQES